MKICFIIDHFANGGAERVVSVLSDEMIKQKHDVSIIVAKDVRNYKVNDKINYIVSKGKSKLKVLRRLKKMISIRKSISQINPDVIYSFGYFMNLYSIVATLGLKKNKFIISERTDPRSEPVSSLAKKIRNFMYNSCDILVCQTVQAKEYFSEKLQKKCVVIPNPIKTGLPERYKGERKKEIVTACRLEKQKNLSMMINAFSEIVNKYPEYKLIIYGEGTLREDLNYQINKLGLQDKVLMPGFEKDVHKKIREAAMFVSSSDYEGISNSMLEAMGMGLPVICTDCPVGGAALAIRDHENGCLIKVGDTKGMASCIEYYICNPDVAIMYGIQAMEVNEIFNVKKISDMWLELSRNEVII